MKSIPAKFPFDKREALYEAIRKDLTIFASSNPGEVAPDSAMGGYLFRLIANRSDSFVIEKVKRDGCVWIHCEYKSLSKQNYIENAKKTFIQSDSAANVFIFDTFDPKCVNPYNGQRTVEFMEKGIALSKFPLTDATFNISIKIDCMGHKWGEYLQVRMCE